MKYQELENHIRGLRDKDLKDIEDFKFSVDSFVDAYYPIIIERVLKYCEIHRQVNGNLSYTFRNVEVEQYTEFRDFLLLCLKSTAGKKYFIFKEALVKKASEDDWHFDLKASLNTSDQVVLELHFCSIKEYQNSLERKSLNEKRAAEAFNVIIKEAEEKPVPKGFFKRLFG